MTYVFLMKKPLLFYSNISPIFREFHDIEKRLVLNKKFDGI